MREIEVPSLITLCIYSIRDAHSSIILTSQRVVRPVVASAASIGIAEVTKRVEGLCKLINQNYRSLKSIKFIHCKFTMASFNAICDLLCMHCPPQAHELQHFSIKTSSFLEISTLPAGLISLLSSGRMSCEFIGRIPSCGNIAACGSVCLQSLNCNEMYDNLGAQSGVPRPPVNAQANPFGNAFSGGSSGFIRSGLGAYGEKILGSSSEYVQSNIELDGQNILEKHGMANVKPHLLQIREGKGGAVYAESNCKLKLELSCWLSLEGDISRYFSDPQYYFQVNDQYVRNKLKVVLFPLLHRGHWTRITEPVGGRLSYKPPIYDINAPDLYIPFMAFGTYIVLAGLALGLQGRFTPEALNWLFIKGLVGWFLEVSLLKMTLFSLGSGEAPVLDIVSYAGYTFTGLSIALLGTIIWSHSYYFLMPWTSLCMGIFLVKTMKRVLFAEVRTSDSSRHHYLLLFIALAQFPLLFWLGKISLHWFF
ncbi:hypothetical protein RND71_043179 [Anisodus tanguticus]|uniref:Uncharacterized protein n=1 Tax=Anisodus tanguticus TaxID=243964 RepID=A0AAE1UPX2_9SOLA|nr:hypothetical protein RND71_043179 [Anisodus tanguticus]